MLSFGFLGLLIPVTFIAPSLALDIKVARGAGCITAGGSPNAVQSICSEPAEGVTTVQSTPSDVWVGLGYDARDGCSATANPLCIIQLHFPPTSEVWYLEDNCFHYSDSTTTSNYILDKAGNTLCLDLFLGWEQCSKDHTTTTNPYLVLADTRERIAGGRNVLTPKCPRPRPVHGRPVYYPQGKPRWRSSIQDGEEIAQVVPPPTSEPTSDENGNIVISPTVSQTQNTKTEDFTNYPESAEGILSNYFTQRNMKRKTKRRAD